MVIRPEAFAVPVDDARIVVRHYPAPGVSVRRGVLLVHGLLGSADIFDVPGLESISFARRLCTAGWPVAAYDQRGAGRSTAGSWQFGLETHGLRDLPAVLATCRERLGWDAVALIGHSLGGLIWLECLRGLQQQPRPDLPQVVSGVVIASPGALDRRQAPWNTVLSRGAAFIEDLDRNHDAIVDRVEFAVAQVVLDWPWARPFVRPWGIAAAIRLGAATKVGAALVRRSPLPTLIYNRDDFDDRTFRDVLRSKTLDVASLELFRDLTQRLQTGIAPTTPPLTLPLLAIGSAADRLVPFHEVEAFARHFARSSVLATEDAFSDPSGHAGYFFRAGLRDAVFDAVLGFLESAGRP